MMVMFILLKGLQPRQKVKWSGVKKVHLWRPLLFYIIVVAGIFKKISNKYKTNLIESGSDARTWSENVNSVTGERS